MRCIRRAAQAALILSIASAAAVSAHPVLADERPRLVVVISVDQLRPGYLTRFQDLFLPAGRGGSVGGFRYLMERGAQHLNAHHDHLTTHTGPGHAVLLTGAYPYKHGIVANHWYDRELGKERNCVEDPSSPQVGVQREIRGASPSALLVSTVGDELKMAEGERVKVWSVSVKDRSAIFLGGHLADGVLWFDVDSGRWVSSRFYTGEGGLPGWVRGWNDRKKPHAAFGKTWEISVPEEALARLWKPGGRPVRDEDGLGMSFPHPLDGGAEAPGRAFFDAFTTSPRGNAFVLETAREIVRAEGLGKDDLPDLLGIGLSTNDWAGHAFGPHSPEVLDITVQTDRQLSEFFGFLQEQVPGGLARVTIVLCADHGVAPVIPGATGAGMPGGLRNENEVSVVADAALDAAFGDGDWIREVSGANLYLNLSTVAEKGIPRKEAERIAAEAVATSDGVYAAYSRTRILEGRLPRTDIGRRVSRSFHPERSGDVILVEAPYWVTSWGAAGASHGSPYTYDTAVPLLLAGAGIKPGRYAQRVSTLDIAPTLSAILRIPLPSGSEGRVLGHLLRRGGG